MNLNQELTFFRSQFKKYADPQRAQKEKQYLKSHLKFYGVDTPIKRQIIKHWFKTHPNISTNDIIKLSQKLWGSPWHEEWGLAVILLHRINKKLTLKHMPVIEKMINQSFSWSHLDEISCRLVGTLIDTDPRTLKYLSKWAKSKNFWVRRAALLSQIPQFRKKQGDKQLFFKLAVPMFKEAKNWSKQERFFIRKAIGWVLREIAQKEPIIVFDFVKKYKSQMSGLTFREATRKLPPSMQKQLQN